MSPDPNSVPLRDYVDQRFNDVHEAIAQTRRDVAREAMGTHTVLHGISSRLDDLARAVHRLDLDEAESRGTVIARDQTRSYRDRRFGRAKDALTMLVAAAAFAYSLFRPAG